MTDSKQFLYIDQAKAGQLKKAHKRGANILRQIAGSYKDLNVGSITRERLEGIFQDDFSAIEADMKRPAQFAGNKLRGRPDISEFKAKARQLVDWFNQIGVELENFFVSGGEIILPNKVLSNQVEQECAVYIDNPQEAKLLELLQAAQEKCNLVKDYLGKQSINTPLFKSENQAGFLVEGAQAVSINKELFKS